MTSISHISHLSREISWAFLQLAGEDEVWRTRGRKEREMRIPEGK